MPYRCQISLNTTTLYAGGPVSLFSRVITHAVLPSAFLDADGGTCPQSDGGDIWVSLNQEGTVRLPVDIVYVSLNNNPASSVVEFWVQVPDSTTDTVWVHWGGEQTSQPAVTSPYGRNAVWSGGFGMVHRYFGNPASGDVDRTGNGRDGSVRAGAPTVGSRSGMLNPCREMTTGDILQWAPRWLCANYATWTFSLQMESDVNDNDGLIGEGNTPGPYLAVFTATDDIKINIKHAGGITEAAASSAIPSTPFTLTCVRRGDEGADMEVWVDGTDATTGSSGPTAPSTFTPNPDESYAAANLNGAVSLLAVSTVARDSAWISAWALQLSNPATGLTASSVEEYDPLPETTAGALTYYSATRLLKHLLGKLTYASPSLYLALVTATANDASDGFTISEPVGNGYERKALTGSDFNSASGGQITNATDIDFAESTDAWDEVVGWALCDAATNGNVLAYGSLNTPRTLTAGQVARFASGQFVIGFETGACISNAYRNKILDHLCGKATLVAPSTYATLMTVVPTRTSTGATITEPDGSFSRTLVEDDDWDVDGLATSTNTSTVTFPEAGADWSGGDDILAAALVDDPDVGEGNVILWYELDVPKSILAGDTPYFTPGSMEFTLK